MANKRLYRDSRNKVLGGVCSGLANYFNLDVALLRVLFVVAFLFASFGFWLYIILWVVIPIDGQQIEENESGTNHRSETVSETVSSSASKSTSLIAGIAVMLMGVIFLINNFIPISWVWKLWPLILVAIGVVMIVNASKKGDDNGQEQ